MSGSYWEAVRSQGLDVPSDRPLAELTAELTRMLGDADPDIREGIACRTLSTWVARGVYDDLLAGLGDGMATGLVAGLGESGTDTVFRRSSSALVLGACLARDNERSLVPGDKILEWGDRLATWLLREQDVRGFVPGRGWAHAIAHGADALATLAASPHVAPPELTVVLDVIADRVLARTDTLFTHGEADRLAAATMAVLRRNEVTLSIAEPWVERITRVAVLVHEPQAGDPYLHGGNAEAFLRSLYLQLALAPAPPAIRADLLLVLVDALRTTNAAFLAR